MKIDVVACYYNQWAHTPFFEWGIQQNAEHIDRVFVVSDGPFLKKDYVQQALPMATLLEHPKFPHGVGPSLDMGIAASNADYVFTMSYDQVLPPRALAKMIDKAHPKKLVIGSVDAIPDETRLSDLPHPPVTRADNITSRATTWRNMLRPWSFARNGCTLVNTKTHRGLGGYDHRFAYHGYGLEDLEFGARFCRDFGMDAIVLSSARTWHFSSKEPTTEERLEKSPKPEAFILLVRTLADLYQYKYTLFAHKLIASDSVLVTDTNQKATGGDARLDCEYPSWIDDTSANCIETYLPNPGVTNPERHLVFLLDKLRPGGTLRIRGNPNYDLLSTMSNRLGFWLDVESDYVELSYD